MSKIKRDGITSKERIVRREEFDRKMEKLVKQIYKLFWPVLKCLRKGKEQYCKSER